MDIIVFWFLGGVLIGFLVGLHRGESTVKRIAERERRENEARLMSIWRDIATRR